MPFFFYRFEGDVRWKSVEFPTRQCTVLELRRAIILREGITRANRKPIDLEIVRGCGNDDCDWVHAPGNVVVRRVPASYMRFDHICLA